MRLRFVVPAILVLALAMAACSSSKPHQPKTLAAGQTEQVATPVTSSKIITVTCQEGGGINAFEVDAVDPATGAAEKLNSFDLFRDDKGGVRNTSRDCLLDRGPSRGAFDKDYGNIAYLHTYPDGVVVESNNRILYNLHPANTNVEDKDAYFLPGTSILVYTHNGSVVGVDIYQSSQTRSGEVTLSAEQIAAYNELKNSFVAESVKNKALEDKLANRPWNFTVDSMATSPDGQTAAFIGYDQPHNRYGLYTVPAQGGTYKLVTDVTPDAMARIYIIGWQ